MSKRAFIKAAAYGLSAFALASGNIGQAEDIAEYANYMGLKGQQTNTASAANTPVTPADYVHPTLASDNMDDVGLKIIVVFDSSGSIDDTEHKAQMEMIASAIGSDDFRDTLFNEEAGPGSIAICFVEFSTQAKLAIPWIDIRPGDDHKLDALEQEILNFERNYYGGTSQVAGLLVAKQALDYSPWESKSTAINIVTDGRNSPSLTPGQSLNTLVRTLAENYGASVNAFVTLTTSETTLDNWANANLITPDKLTYNGEPVEPGYVEVVAKQTGRGSLEKTHIRPGFMRLAFRRNLMLPTTNLMPADRSDLILAGKRHKPDSPQL